MTVANPLHGDVCRCCSLPYTSFRKHPFVRPVRPRTVRHWSMFSDPRVAVVTLRGQRKPPVDSTEWIEYVPAPYAHLLPRGARVTSVDPSRGVYTYDVN